MSLTLNSWFKNFKKKLIDLIAPKHSVPITRWTANSLWDLSWLRVFLLTIGIMLLGIGGSFTVQSNLGTAPWTVLAQGISVQTGLPLGVSFFLVSLTVLLLWIPLSLKPGYGTIANTVFFALGLQVGIEYIPEPSNTLAAYILLLAGIFITGAGGTLYITCGLGAGPRDGIMLGILGKSRLPITVVRAMIEIVVLLLGYLLGGLVGIGTIIIALLIGRSFSFWFNFYGKFPPKQTGLAT
jgi:uncharacterized membrane protein YczE